MLVFENKTENKFDSVLLPRVIVKELIITTGILGTLNQTQIASLGKYFKDGKLTEAPVAMLANANNKGYCRVLLDQESLQHFKTYLSSAHISSYNRVYLWQILYDHVRML